MKFTLRSFLHDPSSSLSGPISSTFYSQKPSVYVPPSKFGLNISKSTNILYALLISPTRALLELVTVIIIIGAEYKL